MNQRYRRVSHRKRLVLAHRKAFSTRGNANGMASLKATKERHLKGGSFFISCTIGASSSRIGISKLYADSDKGHPPVPPTQLALVTILQAYTGASDRVQAPNLNYVKIKTRSINIQAPNFSYGVIIANWKLPIGNDHWVFKLPILAR